MLALEVYINGKKKCTAGIDCEGVTTSHIYSTSATTFHYSTGALIKGNDVQDKAIQWMNGELHVGDEIAFKVIDSINISKPKVVKNMDELK